LEKHFTSYTYFICLPLEKMVNFFCKHQLSTEDFTFGTGTPLNFSLNPRSALLFFQYSQTLAGSADSNNPKSDFWLVSFRLEIEHLLNLQAKKEFGLWNRLYVDHLFTSYGFTFTDAEWSTIKCWTFDSKVEELVENLNIEMMSNSSPELRRLYHLVLPKDFYDENFGRDFGEDWELVNTEEKDFQKQNQALQFLSLSLSSSEGEATSSLEVAVKEVFITSGGIKFHFIEECPGLQKRTNPLVAVSLEEAKKMQRTLCTYCSDLKNFRTSQCCTLNCTIETLRFPHFCCRKCKDGKGHGAACTSKVNTSEE